MKKSTLTTVLLCLVFLVGLSLLLYPTVSDYLNSLHQSRVIVQYSEDVAALDNGLYSQMLEAAHDYNDELLKRTQSYFMSDGEKAEYNSLLNLSDSGVMGYIEIPSIGVSLPIYHGTDESVLQHSLGHIEWSSLPVGGSGTHCIISGHRGLPSAKLFTNLDKLATGDRFMLCVLDEVLTYEVDQSLIVLPEELEELEISEGQDLCTLVTCTPYGVNSHRLLVRGHRVPNGQEDESFRVTADATQIDPLVMAPLVAAPILLALLLWLIFPMKHKR